VPADHAALAALAAVVVICAWSYLISEVWQALFG
jgi:hypothetical protein